MSEIVDSVKFQIYRFCIYKGQSNHVSIFIWCTHVDVYIICLSLMLIIFGFSFPKLDLMLESSILSSSCESFSSYCNFSSIELSSSNPHSQQQYSVNPVLMIDVNTIYLPSLLRVVLYNTRLVYFLHSIELLTF